MTGYGVTVFEGTRPDTFAVEVMGVLNNVMPDQDIILIKANTELLQHTMIMAGMSGSPIYINERLIGALAYSWSFEKEPIAGVTPIRNILEANQRPSLDTGEQNLKKIQTPLIASGFEQSIQTTMQERLGDYGFHSEFTAGGQATSGGKNSASGGSIEAGSALGVQLMRGDLSLTSIGTVTHVGEDGEVYAFGHPFLGSGQIEYPLTTATVHTYMPSYESSFKLASPGSAVGTITEDRQASIVGKLGIEPDLLPVEINLRSPDQNFQDQYRIEVIRHQDLTPGLINSAVSNFASRKLEQSGINWMESTVQAKLPGPNDLSFQHTDLVQGSYNPWSLLPLLKMWNNPFKQFHPDRITIDLTLHHGRESAQIEDLWVNGTVKPGEQLTVYTRINPYRGNTSTEKISVTLPESFRGNAVRVSAVPATQLQTLEARPETFGQLIQFLEKDRSPRDLAIVIEWPEASIKHSGKRMEHMPLSVIGRFGIEQPPTMDAQATTEINRISTDWILRGNRSQIITTN